MENVNHDLLEKEYFHLQRVVEEFDSKSLTIKAWSVTLGVSIATSKAFTDNMMLLLVAAIGALMFWFIEAYWKTFQYANYRRIGQIEDYFSGKREEIKTPQIGTSWGESYSEGGIERLLRIFFWPHVVLPHGVMCIGFVCAYFILGD